MDAGGDASGWRGSTGQAALDALLAEYEAIRADERTFVTLSAALSSVAVGVIGALATVVANTCAAGHAPPCLRLPDWAFLLIPIAPFALVAYTTIHAGWSAVRNVYLEDLEREIDVRLGDLRTSQGVEVPSFTRISRSIFDPRLGLPSYQAVWAIIYGAYVALLGAFTIWSITLTHSGALEGSASPATRSSRCPSSTSPCSP